MKSLRNFTPGILLPNVRLTMAVDAHFNNWGGTSLNPTNPDRRNEPDNFGSGQDCAAMALARWPAASGTLGVAGEWNDIGGSSALYFVIEYDSSGTAADQIELKAQITVFPNPASDHVMVSSSGTRFPIASVRIYNILGTLLYENTGIQANEHPVSLSEYPSGVYFVQAELKGGQTVRTKFLIRQVH